MKGREEGLKEVAERIKLESLQNTRDLAGYTTADGRIIRPKCLIRSGALAGMSENDKEILFGEYGVRTVIDLRTGIEADEKPDPVIPGVKNIFNPILNEETAGFTHENEDGEGVDMLEGFLKHAKSLNGHPEIYINHLYENLVLNEQAVKHYGTFLNLVLEAEPGAVLWHCSAGKDRAGMATAFLLTAMDVDRANIIRDFTASNGFLQKETEGMVALVRSRTSDPDLEKCAETLCQVHESYIQAAFKTIEERFGDMDTYMENELGFGREKRDRLKAKYC
nr:tyrosine-protein phosphatase [Clostridium sp. MCC353]